MTRAPVISVVPQSIDLALYAGDGMSLRLMLTSGGAPFPLDGEISAQVRAARDALTAIDFAVDMSESDNGVVTLSLTGDQTASLAVGGAYKGFWDVQWQPPAGEPRTVVQGSVGCVPDVTRP